MQHTATHCNTLQHRIFCDDDRDSFVETTRSNTATHCNALQNTATHCNTLQYRVSGNDDRDGFVEITRSDAATHCNTLQHTATRCNTGYLATTIAMALSKSQDLMLDKLSGQHQVCVCVCGCVCARDTCVCVCVCVCVGVCDMKYALVYRCDMTHSFVWLDTIHACGSHDLHIRVA